jgi:hypothetical protein
MPENAPLMDRWVAITAQIRDLGKQLKTSVKQKAVIRKMFNRGEDSYTPAEKEVLRKTSSFNPSQHAYFQDTDDDVLKICDMPENIPLLTKWVAMRGKIEYLERQLEALNKTKAVIRGMFNRKKSSYTQAEKDVFGKTSSSNPYQHPSLQVSGAKPAVGLHRRESFKDTARKVENTVKSEKYINGLKIANWDSIKKDMLSIIIDELKGKGLTCEEVLQVINAIPDAGIRGDFMRLNIRGQFDS